MHTLRLKIIPLLAVFALMTASVAHAAPDRAPARTTVRRGTETNTTVRARPVRLRRPSMLGSALRSALVSGALTVGLNLAVNHSVPMSENLPHALTMGGIVAGGVTALNLLWNGGRRLFRRNR